MQKPEQCSITYPVCMHFINIYALFHKDLQVRLCPILNLLRVFYSETINLSASVGRDILFYVSLSLVDTVARPHLGPHSVILNKMWP